MHTAGDTIKMSMNVALATAAHHSYDANGVTEKSEGHGPIGADEACLPERNIVTRGPVGKM